MASNNVDDQTYSKFFHRSLSPNSFERLRQENSDYFYKPKRGPSTSKSNITITRPLKHVENVKALLDLLTKTKRTSIIDEVQTKRGEHQEPTSNSSSGFSIDEGDSLLSNSSLFSSRSNSSLSTVAEQESELNLVESTEISSSINEEKFSSCLSAVELIEEEYFSSSCHSPAIGINVTLNEVHLALIELYPQNIDQSTIVFQRYLLSLIVHHEHENWSIANVALRTQYEQEANFRLFTLAREEFDRILLQLQSFVNYNSSIASSFVLNIALTGEQTKEYEMKISSRLNKINLNFDIIQYRAESYMIGLHFFLDSYRTKKMTQQDELLEVDQLFDKSQSNPSYPYLLVHAEAGSTFFYIVHSSTQYSILTSTNLCYKTYANLLKLMQPGFEQQMLLPVKNPIRQSFDFTGKDLCHDCYRSTRSFPLTTPLTSFTRIPTRYFPTDYSNSKSSHYVYRGWSNRRVIESGDQTRTTFDVPTQTDDSYIQWSSDQLRLSMQHSLLTMITMNMALILKLILKSYPTVGQCVLTGEFFQLERQAAEDLTRFIRSMLGNETLRVFQMKRESLIAALGCALPRVYFDVVNDKTTFGQDCIY